MDDAHAVAAGRGAPRCTRIAIQTPDDMPFRFRPLAWLPPAAVKYIYTVILRPAPLRAAAQFVIKRFIPEHLTFRGVRLALNQDDAIVSGSLALGTYEEFEIGVFESFLAPGMNVFDVGANIGLYSAMAARRIGSAATVVAVEPGPDNCDFIRKTIALNGYTNVRVFQKAVGDRTGEAMLYLCSNNKADHRIYARGALGERKTVPVAIVRLDDLIAEHALPLPDVMKVDIQGAEQLAIEGMRDTLARQANIVVFMELWPWGIRQAGGDASQLLRTLRELGFRIYELDGDREEIHLVTDDAELAARGLERQHANLLLARDPIDVPAILRAAGYD
ncbi:MAG: FkbM family methyltransferase, partial [Tepidisphaeraceae bacterium]